MAHSKVSFEKNVCKYKATLGDMQINGEIKFLFLSAQPFVLQIIDLVLAYYLKLLRAVAKPSTAWSRPCWILLPIIIRIIILSSA